MEHAILLFDPVAHRLDLLTVYTSILKEHGFLIHQERYIDTFTDEQKHAITTSSDIKIGDHPVLALLVRRRDAISHLRTLLASHELEHAYASPTAWQALRDESWFFPQPRGRLERTLVLLNPGHTPSQYSSLLAALTASGFLLVAKAPVILTTEQAKTLIGSTASAEELQQLCSDVSAALVVERVDAVAAALLAAGPRDEEEARRVAPKSWRVQLATEGKGVGIYTSATVDLAARDLALLSSALASAVTVERIAVLLRPDTAPHTADVIQRLKDADFVIISEQSVVLSRTRAEQLLSAVRHVVDDWTEQVKALSANGPVTALLLEKPNAVEALKALKLKGVHFGTTPEDIQSDIDELFGHVARQTLPSGDETRRLLSTPLPGSKALNEIIVDALAELCRVKPTSGDDAIHFLADYFDSHNPYRPALTTDEQENSGLSSGNMQQHGVAASAKQRAYKITVESSVQVVPSDAEDVGGVRSINALIAAPGVHRLEAGRSYAKQHGYELIDVPSLVKQVAESGTATGVKVKAYTSTQRPVPGSLLVPLLRDALKAVPQNRSLLLCGFPYSLDQSLQFEEVIAPLTRVVVLEAAPGSESTTMTTTTSDVAAKQRASMYKDEILPVVEHYGDFEKTVHHVVQSV